MTETHDGTRLLFGLSGCFVIDIPASSLPILFNVPAQIARFVPEMSFNGSPDVRTKTRC
jgi:hypothetical protein